MTNVSVCNSLSAFRSYAETGCLKAIALGGRAIEVLTTNRKTILKISAVVVVVAAASAVCFAVSLAAGFALIALARQFPTTAKVMGLVTAGITAFTTIMAIFYASILSMMH